VAGLTARLYAANHGLKTVILERTAPGAQILNSSRQLISAAGDGATAAIAAHRYIRSRRWS
jgi:thioredoxin reductase